MNCLGDSAKRTGATIANATLSFVKGSLGLVESLGDFGLTAGGGIVSIGTGIADMVEYATTGKVGERTEKWMGKVSKQIEYTLVDDLDEALGFRKKLDDKSYDFFDSDGTGSKVVEGLGEVVSIVGMACATGGASLATVSPTALATIAGVAGTGSATEEALIQIEEQNKQQLILNEINSISITQEMYDAKFQELIKQDSSKEYSMEEVIQGIYNDLYIQKCRKLNSSDTSYLHLDDFSKANTYGVLSGGVDAAQWYIGAKINSLFKVQGATAKQQLSGVAKRVGLDTLDSVAEVPVRTILKTIYREDSEGNKLSFSDIWNEENGWEQVKVQALIGGGASLLSEMPDIIKATKKLKNSDAVVKNVTPSSQKPEMVLSKKDSEIIERAKKTTDNLEYELKTDGPVSGHLTEEQVTDRVAKIFGIDTSIEGSVITSVDECYEFFESIGRGKDFLDGLSEEQKKAIKVYSGEGYGKINNNFLRKYKENIGLHSDEPLSYFFNTTKKMDIVDSLDEYISQITL